MADTKFWHYRQNNSGGSFIEDDKAGLGVSVFVEALTAEDADQRAERAGIYFNGCENGSDCECCGDRWYTAYGDGSDVCDISRYDFTWSKTVYLHRLNGNIERITSDEANMLQPHLRITA